MRKLLTALLFLVISTCGLACGSTEEHHHHYDARGVCVDCGHDHH